MRFRFSLRLLLALVAVVGVAIYLLYVRPTQLAERFVAAVEQSDVAAAMALLSEQDRWIFTQAGDLAAAIDRVYAEVLPREWPDIWACQRRVIYRVAYHEDTEGRYIHWTHDTDVVAGVSGLRVIDKPARFARQSRVNPGEPAQVDYTLLP
jgi:hypothetical protein